MKNKFLVNVAAEIMYIKDNKYFLVINYKFRLNTIKILKLFEKVLA